MKVHLKDSAEPLQEGTDLVALCGKPIPKAAFAMIWNEKHFGIFDTGEFINAILFCWHCSQKAEKIDTPYSEYWYGIVPGQESEEA